MHLLGNDIIVASP